MIPEPPADATSRFGNRVEAYVKARPGYPPEVVALLREQCGLGPASVVADLGAGTGIFTRLLLEAGAGTVHAVEPNAAMRAALDASVAGHPRVQVREGTGENTGLPEASVDLITVAQAFHWFDRAKAQREFMRVLRPGGWVALVWNLRSRDATPFLAAYERLLQRWGTDYARFNHRLIGLTNLAPFFGSGIVRRHVFASEQTLTFEGVQTLLLSASYAPAMGHPHHAPMLEELRTIFDAHHEGGQVRFAYETEVFLGRFGAPGPGARYGTS